MSRIKFTVTYSFDAKARDVWDELVDWAGHAEWVPATRVELAPGARDEVGAEFTAYTGVGPLTLEDRMRVAEIRWDEGRQHGYCKVDKLGPTLDGNASFSVRGTPTGSVVEWVEDLIVPYTPSFLGPVVAKAGAFGFRLALRSLARKIA